MSMFIHYEPGCLSDGDGDGDGDDNQTQIKSKQGARMGLTDKLLKGVKKRGIGTSLAESDYGEVPYYLSVGTVAMNLMLSGKWNGGVPASKLTMFAGEKGSTKTLNMLEAIKSMQSEYPDSTIVYIDAEHAADKSSLVKYGIDTSKVIYFPLSRIDDEDKEMSLMYQISNLSNEIEKHDKVMMCIDSLGVLTTGRTNNNAESGNMAKDMSINSDKKKFVNMLLEVAGLRMIPIIIINHVYDSVGGFSSDPKQVAGGSVLFLPSQVILISSKAKMTNESDFTMEAGTAKVQTGNIFTAYVYKGRLSKERSKAKFAIHYEHGFLKYYGLVEYALEGGYIEESKDGRATVYNIVGHSDIKATKKTVCMKENYPFWEALFAKTDFGEYLNALFSYGVSSFKGKDVLTVATKEEE